LPWWPSTLHNLLHFVQKRSILCCVVHPAVPCSPLASANLCAPPFEIRGPHNSFQPDEQSSPSPAISPRMFIYNNALKPRSTLA
jgi:hypothetical protein